MMKRKMVGIVIFPEVEVLDFCGPYEVFYRRPVKRGAAPGGAVAFQVLLVAEQAEAGHDLPGGCGCCPIAPWPTCPPLDILVVPGGWGTRRADRE